MVFFRFVLFCFVFETRRKTEGGLVHVGRSRTYSRMVISILRKKKIYIGIRIYTRIRI